MPLAAPAIQATSPATGIARRAQWRAKLTDPGFVLLSVILLASLIVCTIGLDWGLPYLWHTDEKVGQVADMFYNRTLDPNYWYNPHLHIYLIAIPMWIASVFYPGRYLDLFLPHLIKYTNPAEPGRAFQWIAMRVARAVSVLVAAVMVWFLYRVVRRDFGRNTGLLAAAFLAFTMGIVNLAHFATPETVFFLLALVSLGALDAVIVSGRARDYAIVGLFVGLACGTKYTAAALAVPFLVAHVAGRGWRGALSITSIGNMALCAAIAAATFFATTPYALIRWHSFWVDGILFDLEVGAPSGSLITLNPGVRHSWGVYLDLLGTSMGWPLFVLSLFGVAYAIWRLARRGPLTSDRRAYLIHLTWIAIYYGFYGISPHHALRFIMPIVPSLVLLAAVVGTAMVRAAAPRWKLAVGAVPAVVLLYSVAYTARADAMMLGDTRYTAGEWLNRHCYPDQTVDFFSLEAYLPYLDQPTYSIRPIPFVNDPALRGDAFVKIAQKYLASSNHPIMDSEFYYNRFLDRGQRYKWPERVKFYQGLLRGAASEGYAPARTFVYENPWWLDPRPERVAPRIDIFAKPGQIWDCPAR